MSKEATGEVRRSSTGAYSTVIRTFEKRETIQLPTCTDDDEAEARSKLLADVAKRFRLANVNPSQGKRSLELIAGASARSLRAMLTAAEELLGGKIPIASGPTSPTFSKVAGRWTGGELAKLHPDHVKPKDSTHDEKRLAVLFAIESADGTKLGDVPVDRFTLEHAEHAMQNLPKRAKKSATRRHYAQLIHRVLALAVYPLRLIPANPLPKGFMPKAGKPPRFPYLYPDEEAALMAASDEKVELHVRLFYGFLSREGLRVSEAASLTWKDVDLKRGMVRLEENKTDDPRAWALGEDVVRALRTWYELAGGEADEYVFSDACGLPVDVDKLANRLRDDIEAAGVTRAELFTKTANTGKLRAHDLRSTFTTLALGNGRTETWVVDRTGWTSSAMIARYRRQARQVEELELGWLHPLDRVIPELLNATALPHGITRPLGGMADAGDLKGEQAPSVPLTYENQDGGADDGGRRSGACGTGVDENGPGVGAVDVVEAALADALTKASAAGAWDTVAQLARELEARRKARQAPEVVQLEAERARRRR